MIRKLFFKNLPSKYSIDKLVQFIEEKSQCSPNIEIIKNKKNPNNGLAKITPSSKKNEELIKQALGDNFYFEKRKIIVADYSNKKFKMKKKKQKETKEKYLQEKNKKSTKKAKNPNKTSKKTHQTMRNRNPKNTKNPIANIVLKTKKKKKTDLIRSNMKVNHATINNAEVVLNALFLHNIPYHANYYDIEYVLKPLIHIKELILFLDSNNQFKGCAKLLVEKKEDFQKIINLFR
ncbi:RNA and export factor binding protein [Anaeramoeba flamelloides]|uniref:RNA and export factor binding protein n=1 Tax=Anaeramoeba flamelloides TaxID=1746091 RepID=A0AAV7Z2C7_9EUKA|nr:RNA and export factor binding protein [Anaeramoeba flamelloides]